MKNRETPKKPEQNKRNNKRFRTHQEMLFVHKKWREKNKRKLSKLRSKDNEKE